MTTLTWSTRADADLDRLHAFLADKSVRVADRAIDTILDQVRLLELFPEAGRPADTYGVGRRELIIPFGRGAYIALYRYRPDDVLIAAIRHSREAGYADLSGS